MVLARFSEAIAAFNTMLKAADNGSASQFAPCQVSKERRSARLCTASIAAICASSSRRACCVRLVVVALIGSVLHESFRNSEATSHTAASLRHMRVRSHARSVNHTRAKEEKSGVADTRETGTTSDTFFLLCACSVDLSSSLTRLAAAHSSMHQSFHSAVARVAQVAGADGGAADGPASQGSSAIARRTVPHTHAWNARDAIHHHDGGARMHKHLHLLTMISSNSHRSDKQHRISQPPPRKARKQRPHRP